MYRIIAAVALLSVLTLSACAGLPCGNPHPYYTNSAAPPLKAPSNLNQPKPDSAYAIPGETAASGKRTDLDAKGACLITPPEVITPTSSVTPKPAATTPAAPAPVAGSTAAPAVASGGPFG
ncbi:MAG TPA: hypothetical protein VFM15_05990 [Gammaproteobacteria bacterium]|nr:hypothetical protein [Gammaproteobacteria bacterium]